MKNTDQPGFLGQPFADEATPLPDHLTWEVLGDGIIQPQRRWPFVLFFLVAVTIAAGWSVSSNEVHPQGLFPLPALQASDDLVPLLSIEELTVAASAPTLPFPPQIAGEKTTKLRIAANEAGGYSISTVSRFPLEGAEEKTAKLGTTASIVTTEFSTNQARALANNAVLPLAIREFNVAFDNELVTELRETKAEEGNSTSPATEKTTSSQVILLAGTSNHGGKTDFIDPLYTTYFSAAYRKSVGNKWYWSAGLSSQRFVRRAELANTRSTTFYRPGTVDTIFRNVSTGAERIVTTDSVSGLRQTAFTGYGRVTLLTIPVSIGWQTPALGGALGWNVGIAPGIAVTKTGRAVTPLLEIEPIENRPVWRDQFYLGLNSSLHYSYDLTSKLSLQSSVGVSYLIQPKITAWNLSIGVGYRW